MPSSRHVRNLIACSLQIVRPPHFPPECKTPHKGASQTIVQQRQKASRGGSPTCQWIGIGKMNKKRRKCKTTSVNQKSQMRGTILSYRGPPSNVALRHKAALQVVKKGPKNQRLQPVPMRASNSLHPSYEETTFASNSRRTLSHVNNSFPSI
uniref:Uncharacterized protein n=1 Tax=Trypanosoma congolense (strain IL3000) TaxID=1068625 RepID=G0UPV0_TRYCI|nr:hypothetical protein TCIL3000_7_2210 [Trypanosoma congolense IL3000]